MSCPWGQPRSALQLATAARPAKPGRTAALTRVRARPVRARASTARPRTHSEVERP